MTFGITSCSYDLVVIEGKGQDHKPVAIIKEQIIVIPKDVIYLDDIKKNGNKYFPDMIKMTFVNGV